MDNGFVYNFYDGNGDESGDKVKIFAGDLNQYIVYTYHDGDSS